MVVLSDIFVLLKSPKYIYTKKTWCCWTQKIF